MRTDLASAAASGLQHRWDFGDGQGSELAQPEHRYAVPGRYEVGLTLSNAAGEQMQARASVHVGRYARLSGRQCSASNDQGWCWMQPLPYVSAITEVDFASAQLGSAVDEADFVLLTWISEDAGLSWRQSVLTAEEMTSAGVLWRRR